MGRKRWKKLDTKIKGFFNQTLCLLLACFMFISVMPSTVLAEELQGEVAPQRVGTTQVDPGSLAKVSYVFLAKDAKGEPIKDIPQEILQELPQAQTKNIGEKVNSTPLQQNQFDSPYKDRPGTWSFSGWSRDNLVVSGDLTEDTFVGTWTFTDKDSAAAQSNEENSLAPKQMSLRSGEATQAGQSKVSYKYEAKDAMGRVITDIPQEVLATLPPEQAAGVGDSVNPGTPTTTKFDNSSYKDRKGHWRFKGWEKKSLTVSGDATKDVFVGNWEFRDLGFGRSPYMGNQFIDVDLQKTMKVGKFTIEIKLDRLEGVERPNPDPFSLPETYEIRKSLVGDPDKKGNVWGRFETSEKVATGRYRKDNNLPKWEKDATEGGYLIDSYGKAVTLPLFDENGVGIEYQVQNLDMPFHEDGKQSNHHHRWWRLNGTPGHAFEKNEETGENIMRLNNYEGYTELVSSEFRSTWLTSTPEADRPEIRAIVPSNDPELGSVYVPLLKKNYKDNPDNFVRVRSDGVNDSWLHNYTYDEDKEQFGLLDHYRDQDTGEEFSDLREKFPVALEGIDQDGFIEKDGHRFKSSITYDIYDGAFATFQEEYKLTFHTEGGEFSDQKTEKFFPVLHGDTFSQAVEEPTRQYYIFKGWRLGLADPLKSFDPAATTTVTNNMDIYAIWEKKPMVVTEEPKVTDGSGNQVTDKDYRKVTFDANTGAFADDSTAVSYWILKDASFAEAKDYTDKTGKKILLVPTATKDDHDWLGWADKSDKTAADYKTDMSDFTQAADSKDLTFYAIYVERAKGTVNYEFKAKDADGNAIANLPAELEAVLPTDDTQYRLASKVQPKAVAQKVSATYDGKAGNWIFEGWSPTELTITDQENKFVGTWKFNINKYTLTFDTEGGKFSDSGQKKAYYVLHGDTLKVAEANAVKEPSRQYYTFKGWRVGTADPVTLFNPVDPVTGNMDMHAMWERKPLVVTEEPKIADGSGNQVVDKDYRKVTFDANTGAFAGDSKKASYWILKDASFAEAKDYTNKAGQKVLSIPTAHKDDYNWLGWSQDQSKTAADYKTDLTNFTEVAGSTADLTFYAIYKEKPKGTVSYKFEAKDANGASIATLPQELKALLPTDSTQYIVDTKVQPKAVTSQKLDATYDNKPGSWNFGGWSPAELTIQEGSNTFTGVWSFVVKEYTLTFHTEGGKFSDATTEKAFPAHHGDTFTEKVQDPSREFYTFKGWRVGKEDPVKPFDPTEPITGSMDMYAMWEKKPMVVTEEPKVTDGSGNQVADKEYRKVTFDANTGAFTDNNTAVSYWILKDASFDEAKAETNKAGQKILLVPTANKDDHNWLGWSQDQSKTAADYKTDLTDFTEQAGSTADLTFYAVYTEKAKGIVKYTFQAKDADGKVIQTLPEELNALLPSDNTRYLLENKVKVTPKNPTKTQVEGNYAGKAGTWNFEGWEPSKLEVKEAVNTFVGTWSFKINTYKLNFHTEGGKFTDQKTEKTFTVLHGERLTDAEAKEVKAPTRQYYTFKGWRVGQNDPIIAFDAQAPVSKNMDMYAMWEKKPMVVTEEPKVPSEAGGQVPDKEYRKVTFDANSGAFADDSKSVSYWILNDASFEQALQAVNPQGDKILAIPTAHKADDYDWLGWADKNNKTAADYKADLTGFTETAGSTANLTFYAVYKEKAKGTVSYKFEAKDPNGAAVSALPQELKALLPTDNTRYLLGAKVQPKNPDQTKVSGTYDGKKGNWTFAGWTPESIDVQETGNSFTGTWNFVVNKYKLTFNTEGGKFSDNEQTKIFSVQHGDSLKAEDFAAVKAPTRDYYVFKGWRVGKNDPVKSFDATAPVTQNMDMYAIWEEKPVVVTEEPKLPGGQEKDPDYRKVTFDPNSGLFGNSDQEIPYWFLKNKSFAEARAAVNAAGSKLLVIPTATKDEYDWMGWAEDKAGNPVKRDLSDFTEAAGSTEDLLFYAIYKEKVQGTVSYNFLAKDSAGNILSILPEELKGLLPEDTQQYAEGDRVQAKTLATTKVKAIHANKEGTWNFEGWEPTELQIKDKGNKFVGTWKFTPKAEKPDQPGDRDYRIHFDYAGGWDSTGKLSHTIHAKMNESIRLIEAPVRVGYRFLYWEDSRYNPGDTYVVKGDREFKAVWVKVTPGSGQSGQPGNYGQGHTSGKTTQTSKAGTMLPRTGEMTYVPFVLSLISVALILIAVRRKEVRK